MTDTHDLLTPLEHATIALLREAASNLCRVVSDGPMRPFDLAEILAPLHEVQRAVQAQAAARVFPHLRLLGDDGGMPLGPLPTTQIPGVTVPPGDLTLAHTWEQAGPDTVRAARNPDGLPACSRDRIVLFEDKDHPDLPAFVDPPVWIGWCGCGYQATTTAGEEMADTFRAAHFRGRNGRVDPEWAPDGQAPPHTFVEPLGGGDCQACGESRAHPSHNDPATTRILQWEAALAEGLAGLPVIGEPREVLLGATVRDLDEPQGESNPFAVSPPPGEIGQRTGFEHEYAPYGTADECSIAGCVWPAEDPIHGEDPFS